MSKAISILLIVLKFFLVTWSSKNVFSKSLNISKLKQVCVHFWELILLHRFHRLQTIDWIIIILFKYINFLSVTFALWNLFFFIPSGFLKVWHVTVRNWLLGIPFMSILMYIIRALDEKSIQYESTCTAFLLSTRAMTPLGWLANAHRDMII